MTPFAATLLRLSLLGSLLTLLLWLLSPLLRRWGGQRLCYYLWAVVLLRLCLPVGVTLTLPAPANPAVTAPVELPAPAELPSPEEAAADTTTASPAREPAAPKARVPLTLLWGAGAAASLLWYGAGYRRFVRWAKRDAAPASPGTAALLAEMDPGGRVAVLVSPGVAGPVLTGPLRPVLLLPPGLPEERLRDVLAHELIHARRHDLLYKWVAAGVTALHWFNPVMPLLRRQLARSCELSCDEAVTQGMDTAARRHYGETLLALAAAGPAPRPLTATLLGEGDCLRERLLAVAEKPRRGKLRAALALAAALALCGCALVTGAERQSSVSCPAGDDALPVLRGVLLGERPFDCHRYENTDIPGGELFIGDLPRLYNPDSDYTRLWRFALVDLDRDGETEAVVQIIDAAGDMGGYLILHALHQQEGVQGFLVDYRWFEALKTDGTFLRTNHLSCGVLGPFEFQEDAASRGFSVGAVISQEPPEEPARWYVGGVEASRETFEAAMARQEEKPDALWYDFTPEEIARVVPGDQEAG